MTKGSMWLEERLTGLGSTQIPSHSELERLPMLFYLRGAVDALAYVGEISEEEVRRAEGALSRAGLRTEVKRRGSPSAEHTSGETAPGSSSESRLSDVVRVVRPLGQFGHADVHISHLSLWTDRSDVQLLFHGLLSMGRGEGGPAAFRGAIGDILGGKFELSDDVGTVYSTRALPYPVLGFAPLQVLVTTVPAPPKEARELALAVTLWGERHDVVVELPRR